MERTQAMQQWLKYFMDDNGCGQVLIDRQDGIPGNCCLTYLGTQELSREKALTPKILIRKRSHFYLTCLCADSAEYDWLEALENWVSQRVNENEGPAFEGAVGQVTVCNGRRTETRNDGTSLYGADLFVEYTVSYSREDPMGIDMFLLDEEAYFVDVVSLQREFELREALPGCTTLDGTYHRELLGTYFHYTMTVRCRDNDQELERFWEKISQPAQSILCTFPYGADMLTQRMYVESATQELPNALGGNVWDRITVRFRGLEPQVVA